MKEKIQEVKLISLDEWTHPAQVEDSYKRTILYEFVENKGTEYERNYRIVVWEDPAQIALPHVFCEEFTNDAMGVDVWIPVRRSSDCPFAAILEKTLLHLLRERIKDKEV